MTTIRPLAALILAAAALASPALVPVVGAQDAKPAQVPVRDQWQAAQVSLDFPGGTVARYVEALRKAATPMPVNITFSGNAQDAELPPVSFRNVQIETAIRAIGQLESGNTGVRLILEEVPNRDRSQPVGPNWVMGVPLYVVSIHAGPDRSNRASKVLSLNDIIAERAGEGRLPADVVLGAIETGFQKDSSGVDLRFHKDSGLLFVSGYPLECELAEEVVNRLREDVRRAAGAAAGNTRVTNETFRLAHVDTSRVADAIRLAFPSDPRLPDPVQVIPDPKTNSVVIAAQEPLMVAVRSVVRSVDRRQDDNPMMLELRATESQARRQAEHAEMEVARLREEAMKCADQASHTRADLEVLRARSEEVARQREMAEKTRQEIEQHARNMRDEIEKLQSQLAACHQERSTLQKLLEEAKKPK